MLQRRFTKNRVVSSTVKRTLHLLNMSLLPTLFGLTPFTPKISILILLTVCHTFPMMLVLSIWCLIKQYPLVDIFRNSRHESARQCIDIVRKNYLLVTSGSKRVNKPR